MWERILAFAVLMGSGLLAGEILAVAVAVVPSEGKLPPLAYAQWHTTFSRHMDRFTPYLAMSTVVLGAALCFTSPPGPIRALFVVGTFAIVVVGVISQTGNVPLNRRLSLAGPDTPTAEIEKVRKRWRELHFGRTVAAILSLAAFAAAHTIIG
jgi:uncharacterized membrane protein